MAFSRSRPNCLIPTMFYVSRALYDFRYLNSTYLQSSESFSCY